MWTDKTARINLLLLSKSYRGNVLVLSLLSAAFFPRNIRETPEVPNRKETTRKSSVFLRSFSVQYLQDGYRKGNFSYKMSPSCSIRTITAAKRESLLCSGGKRTPRRRREEYFFRSCYVSWKNKLRLGDSLYALGYEEEPSLKFLFFYNNSFIT